MNAVIINDLFIGNQAKELEAWLDLETPYDQSAKWQSSPDNTHMVKTCEELNTFHKCILDKAREIFSVHNLLPSFCTINWYEPGVEKSSHVDIGPVEYTILYNYFSNSPLEFIYNDEKLKISQGQAIAYCGSEFEHMVKECDAVNVRLTFNFASPDNYYFILGNHTKEGFEFPSGRIEQEIGKDWL